MADKNKIEIYQTRDDISQIRVQIWEEMVWLYLKQLSKKMMY